METSTKTIAMLPPKVITILEPETRSEIEEALRYCESNQWKPTIKIEHKRLIALEAMGMLEGSKEPYLKITLTGHPNKFFFAHFWVVRFHLDRVELAVRYLAKSVTA